MTASIEDLVIQLKDHATAEAAGADLLELTKAPESKAKVASAGAIEPLVALLDPQTPAGAVENAAVALLNLVRG